MKSIETIIKESLEVNDNNVAFNNEDLLSIAQMFFCEAQELIESVEMAFLTDDLTGVVSECADCFILLFLMFRELGIDTRAVEMKNKRNAEKYFGYTDKQKARDDWALKGGDKAFMEKYIDNLED